VTSGDLKADLLTIDLLGFS